MSTAETDLDAGDWWKIQVGGWASAVPYDPNPQREDGTTNHGFKDLRTDHGRIALIPEIADSLEMQSLLRTINAPTGPFASYGCNLDPPETNPHAHPGDPDVAIQAYVDVGFISLHAKRKQDMIGLAQTLLAACPFTKQNLLYVDLQIREHRHFDQVPGRWCLRIELTAFGRGADEAARNFSHALSELNEIIANPDFHVAARAAKSS